MTAAALTLRAFNDLFPDESAAQAWFERTRWPAGRHAEMYVGAPPRKRAKRERADDAPPPPNPKGRDTKRTLHYGLLTGAA